MRAADVRQQRPVVVERLLCSSHRAKPLGMSPPSVPRAVP